jgi:hypothetical protein
MCSGVRGTLQRSWHLDRQRIQLPVNAPDLVRRQPVLPGAETPFPAGLSEIALLEGWTIDGLNAAAQHLERLFAWTTLTNGIMQGDGGEGVYACFSLWPDQN